MSLTPLKLSHKQPMHKEKKKCRKDIKGKEKDAKKMGKNEKECKKWKGT